MPNENTATGYTSSGHTRQQCGKHAVDDAVHSRRELVARAVLEYAKSCPGIHVEADAVVADGVVVSARLGGR